MKLSLARNRRFPTRSDTVSGQDKGPAAESNGPARSLSKGLDVRLGFFQAKDFLSVLPLAAFLEKFHPLVALKDTALGTDGTCST